jgi:acetylglutamate kinase
MNKVIMQNLVSRAEVLVEALPYIRAFSGKYFVVKYGGQAMVNEALMASVIVDIVLLKYIGVKPVLVHGGGKEVNEIMHKFGKQPHFVDGLRVTDDETMEIVEMVLLGKVNRQIVSLINQQGGKAVGLSGRDAGLFQAERKAPQQRNGSTTGETVDLGRVGDIVMVDPTLIHTLSDNGYIPVVSSIGSGPSGESLNINADHVAGELAAALEADKLILLTDVEGVYKETGQGPEFISTVREEEVRDLIRTGQINGGMIPKVQACLQALEQGVTRTHIIDGRVAHALLLEIFTDEGIGTMVIK